MILWSRSIKKNGMEGHETWYVTGEWHNENGYPFILFSTDKRKARWFETEADANEFTKKFLQLGQIDKEFNKIY